MSFAQTVWFHFAFVYLRHSVTPSNEFRALHLFDIC